MVRFSLRQPKLITVSTTQDVPVGISEVVLITKNIYAENNTLMVAIFNAICYNGSLLRSSNLILRILANTEIIGGTIANVPNTATNEYITATGIKYFTTNTTATVSVTAKDLSNTGMSIKTGSTLTILLIPL